jgi:hypothetical protein
MMVKIPERAERRDGPSVRQPVTCEEFQARMPELLGADIRNHGHLKTCARCAALLDELEYIASIARDLLPVYEPRETVWEKIHASLPKSSAAAAKTNGHIKTLHVQS